MIACRRFLRALAASVAIGVALTTDVVLACPNCKDSLVQNDPTAAGIVQGYFWSIILMLSMPFLLLIGLSSYFYLLVRRARKQAVASGATPATPAIAVSSLPAWSPSLDT